MRTFGFLLGLVFFTLSLVLPFASAEPQVNIENDRWSPITKIVEKMISKKQISGAQVLVQHQGEIVYFSSLGMRDIKEKAPLLDDSIFRIYSMTKPITSVAVMMLVEEGKLELDKSVGSYIPELQDMTVYGQNKRSKKKHNMTIRQLMNHTSGFTYGFFSDTPVDKMYQKSQPLNSKNNQEMIEKLSQAPLLYPPQSKWHYSIATDVLGHIVETISKQSLSSFFKSRIFEPLEMKDTAFYIENKKLPRFASSYGPKWTLVERYNQSYFQIKNRIQSGGGGLVSTSQDYLHFCQMLLQKGTWKDQQLLQSKTVEEMTKNQLPSGILAYGYFGFGLGFQIQTQDWGNKGHIGEYGWSGAASTHFWISPKDDLIVIAMSQQQPFSNQLKDKLNSSLQQKSGTKTAPITHQILS